MAAALVVVTSAHAGPATRYDQASLEAELGRYEEIALAEALAREQTTIDPQPEGKRVGRIRVVNHEVFDREDGFLRIFNNLHITTREHVIEREVLLRPGELWDERKIDETARNLEVPEFSSLVVIVPVRSSTPSMVDVLVVTRDVWSLRTNAKFEVQNDTLVRLLMFPAENNFLGFRKQVALAFDLDLGALSVGPSYTDPNIMGTRLRFSGFYQAIFNRYSKDHEGSRTALDLSLPLYSLDRSWGASLRFARQNFIHRTFRDTDVILHPDPLREDAVPGEENAPREFRLRTTDVAAEGTYSIGTRFENRFSLGFAVSYRRPSLLPDFPGSPELALLFEEEVLGRSERLAGPVARYEGFLPRFATYRNINTLDLVEDVRLGPEVTLEVSPALELVGSEIDLFRLRTTAGWTFDLLRDGYLRAAAFGGSRWEADGVSDADVGGTFKAALPSFDGVGRFVVGAEATELLENDADQILLAGAQTGLRGYQVGEFAGEAVAVGNVEFRTVPLAIKALRLGAVVFWDMGHAAETFSELDIHHDVGIGLRTLLPQDSRFINRFDWAFPLNGPEAGFPGRFSFSFDQFF